MTFRVTYPLITQDGHRDFETREQAEAFAQEKRNNPGRYGTTHSWRWVKIEDVTYSPARAPGCTCSDYQLIQVGCDCRVEG